MPVFFCLAFFPQQSLAQKVFEPSSVVVPEVQTDNDAAFERAVQKYEAGDHKGALALALPSAEAGSANAQYLVGKIRLTGVDGKSDKDAAQNWFKKSAALGNTDAMMELGALALQGHDDKTSADALEWFARAAQMQRPDAMRAIGEMYVKGQGLPVDMEKGRDWLRRAYENQDFIAARILGDSYFEKKPQKAVNWYEKAADAGDFEAAYIAAIMLAENLDVRPDSERQARLMRQAAYSGHPAAMADYGLLVYQGAGVDRSIDEAAEWFRKSAQADDPEGKFLYAFTLAKGEGVEQSFEDAYYWLLKSGESEFGSYQKDRNVLRERLEANVDPVLLQNARDRIAEEANAPKSPEHLTDDPDNMPETLEALPD